MGLQRSLRSCFSALSANAVIINVSKSKSQSTAIQNIHHQYLSSPIIPPLHTKALQYSYKHFSTSRCHKTGNGELDDDEPEYLEQVTNTADRMRLAVRKYVDEYSRSFDCDLCPSESNDEEFAAFSKPPQIKLVGILATKNIHPIPREDCSIPSEDDSHGNELYSEHIANICCEDGITYEPWRVPPTRESIERAIQHANERLDVHGILVFYPIENLEGSDDTKENISSRGPYKCQSTGVYYKSMDDYFRDAVAPEKDVEGYRRKGLRVRKLEDENDDVVDGVIDELGPVYPCTALAVFRILESFQLSLDTKTESPHRLFEGKTITIINRSEVLGLPLATMLSNQGATVYSIDINSILQFMPEGDVRIRREQATITMEHCVRHSNVIITGVPSQSFRVPTEWISENATLINVANESNFDEEEVSELQGVTYVPHVGRVTVAALELNLCLLHQNYHCDKIK